MKRLLPKLAVFLLMPTVVGCSWNLSKRSPYSEIVGREVRLVTEMELRESYDERIDLVEPYTDPRTKPLAVLPAGTVVHINSVKGRMSLKEDWVCVCGVADLPDRATSVDWWYTWGCGNEGHMSIWPAPWEDPTTTPSSRSFTNRGRTYVGSSNDFVPEPPRRTYPD